MIEMIRQISIPIGVAATLATLPGALELILVTSGATRRGLSSMREEVGNFALAVIVPAHNEEALIERAVASLLTSAEHKPKCSVIVVADNCTDTTAARARNAGARVLIRQNNLERGKGYALRFAFDSLMAEQFDGFLIVDADSVVSTNLVPEIVHGLAAGADAMQTRYRVARPLDSSRKQLMDVALLAFNVLRPKGRDRWGLSAGILGNGFALSRRTLLDVPYSADSIVEDLEYHLLLVEARKKVTFVDTATVYGDMPNDEDAQLSQRARWEGGRVRVALIWVPKLVSRLVHGELFVTEPLIELLTIPLAYLGALSALLCVLPIAIFRYYGMFLIGLLVTHVVAAVWLGGSARESFVALSGAPAYILWKLVKIGAIIRSSRSKTQWLRTPRANDVKRNSSHV
jgi:cellulose synthase/poly-beta-1,6-N-acetylglucosamine synthase-like glycosyltransferase